jgi:hypothetical protein
MKISSRRLAGLMLIVGLLFCGVYYFNSSAQGRAYYDFEVANAKFKIRVTAYREKVTFALPGAYYVFESAEADSTSWHKIMTLRIDEPYRLPRDQVRFVNENSAYIFISTYYMVTTDGGHTWSIWNAEKDLPDRRKHNLSSAIREVDMKSDGTGRMMLYPLPGSRGGTPELHTTDYGQHWSVK